ncbi:hypothetical protein [Flavobacterium sp. JP2137]|uniref:hypothetical protein n=1 Tax=Flavobacterium sp. JP2137 TaxID=3414510 RepID=UPI003D2FCE7C
MPKRYLIIQPPLSDKYTFLVDYISENQSYGWATDIQKINYNRKILGDAFNIDVKISLLLSEAEGSTFVFGLGYFVAVLELQNDEQEGRMTFYHCLVDIVRSDLLELFSRRYSNSIAVKWLEVYDYIMQNLTPERDSVQLLKPEE